MKINLSKEVFNKCQKYLLAKEESISSADFYIEYLTENYLGVKSAKDEKDFFKKMLLATATSSNDPEIKAMDEICHISSVHKLDASRYESDKYYQTFKNIKGEDGDVKFMSLQYEPYEGFVFNELEIDQDNYAEITPLGYFEKPFPYLAVVKNDTIWMSVIPHEIETMKQPIRNAHGKVLVLGLGLGYYLFNILSKKEVSKVDVVEYDEKIINLFNKYLLDKFPCKDKLHIIHDDAFKYLEVAKGYDYIFSDIWHNVGDGEMMYLKIKAYESRFKNSQFDYWIETSIIAMLRRQILTVFSEYFEGLKEEDYKLAKNDNDKIINKIYFYHKNTVISSSEDLYNILKDESIKKMAKVLFL